MPGVCKIFTEGVGGDAETSLIKATLERHNFMYTEVDVSEPSGAARFRKIFGNGTRDASVLPRLPVLLVGSSTRWSATEIPELEASGQLRKVLEAVPHGAKPDHCGAATRKGPSFWRSGTTPAALNQSGNPHQKNGGCCFEESKNRRGDRRIINEFLQLRGNRSTRCRQRRNNQTPGPSAEAK